MDGIWELEEYLKNYYKELEEKQDNLSFVKAKEVELQDIPGQKRAIDEVFSYTDGEIVKDWLPKQNKIFNLHEIKKITPKIKKLQDYLKNTDSIWSVGISKDIPYQKDGLLFISSSEDNNDNMPAPTWDTFNSFEELIEWGISQDCFEPNVMELISLYELQHQH